MDTTLQHLGIVPLKNLKKTSNMHDITVEELKNRMDEGNAPHIIDVRETYEYAEYNIGGELIPLGELSAALLEWEGKKNEEIVVHCRSGMRSRMAQQLMEQAGFGKVRNLIGGVLEWQSKIG